MRLISIFNTCGLSGKENADEYVGRIESLLAQADVDQRVVWSSCLNHPRDWDRLMKHFGDRISYCLTGEHLTVNQSFNLACIESARRLGTPDGFLYIDSGVHFEDQKNVVWTMAQRHDDGPRAMTACTTNTDTGEDWWFKGVDLTNIGPILEIGPGRGFNLHCQIFDRALFDTFDRVLPDIMANFATESCFPYLCQAVRKKFIVCRDVQVRHNVSLDGASFGFVTGPGQGSWTHLLPCAPRRMEDIVADPEARACGLGYEEWLNVLPHDPELYKVNGMVKDPERLARFIKNNLFLPTERFDYNHVEHVFIS